MIYIPTGIRVAGSSHTFLFADLVGFTALTESEGDERALEVALQLQRATGELVDAHCAERVKATGDGVMLHCADPSAAVRLGLALIGALASDDRFPALRVGVHTGPALDSGGDWYGRTVNVAARLCTVARGGEVLISEATRAAAGAIRGAEYGGRELHWLRNVTDPIVTYRVRPKADRLARARGALRGRFACPAMRVEAIA